MVHGTTVRISMSAKKCHTIVPNGQAVRIWLEVGSASVIMGSMEVGPFAMI